MWGRGSPSEMVKVLGGKIFACEFDLQSFYYIHFWTNTLEKGLNPLIPSAIG